jgi:hypothetical protein
MSEDKQELIREIMDTINEVIRRDKHKAKTPGGIEVDTPPEWCDILEQDGRIIRSYEKVGWRVVWYTQEYAVKPTRRWLAIRPANYRPKG